LQLHGRSVLEHSLITLLDSPRIAGVMLALAPEDTFWSDTLWPSLRFSASKPLLTCIGGAQRSHSVLACLRALRALTAVPSHVAVHDAARPCLSARDLESVLAEGSARPEGAILASPMSDSLKRAVSSMHQNAQIAHAVPREGLWLAQTPQVFPLALLYQALSLDDHSGFTDEASAVEKLGVKPWLVAASDPNPKLTFAQDFAWAEHLLAHRSSPPRACEP